MQNENTDISNLSDKEIKRHSSKNPTEVFVSDDGRFVFNGQIFKSKEDLERAIKIYSKFAQKASNSRFWRFFLGIKKRK